MEMNVTTIIAGAAVLGTLGGFVIRGWSTIRSVFQRITTIIFTQVELRDEVTAHAVLGHLNKAYRRSQLYVRTYGGTYEHSKDGKYGHVPFEFFGGRSLVFWRGWWPLLYMLPNTDGKDNDRPWWYTASKKGSQACVVYIRGTFDAEQLIADSSQSRNELHWSTGGNAERRRFFIKKVPNPSKDDTKNKFSAGTGIAWFHEGIYRLISHQASELGQFQQTGGNALDNLLFPDRIMALIDEIRIWRTSREFYVKRGIPWKRGWTLFGPPGTGKTALVRAFAEDLDMPVFVFSLGTMLNEDLERSWAEMQAHTPCIALLEDFDNVFHGRQNVFGRNPMAGLAEAVQAAAPPRPDAPPPADGGVAKTGMLSFDCLLNCLDGADKVEGVFTVITTNHIEKLDPALGVPRRMPDGTMEFISSRPGRMDKAIELGYMEEREKRKLADRILGEFPDGLAHVQRFITDHPDLQETPAQFQERCSQVAITYFWQKVAAEKGLSAVNVDEARNRALRVVPKEAERQAA